MLAMTRIGFAAFILIVGTGQVVQAAAIIAPENPAVMQSPQTMAGAQANNAPASQGFVPPGMDHPANTGSVQIMRPKPKIQSGNDFNFMEGGGG